MRKNIPQFNNSSGSDHSSNSIVHVNESSLIQVSSGSKEVFDKSSKRKLQNNNVWKKINFLMHCTTFLPRTKNNTTMWNKLSNRNKLVQKHHCDTKEDQRQEVNIPRENPAQVERSTKVQISKLNFLELIQHEILPKDLFPEILSFAGPQTARSLSLTSKLWRKKVLEESVWKVLCEQAYKWSTGDTIPKSWFNYYCSNPSIPNDYSSIESLMNSINNPRLIKSSEDDRKFKVMESSFRILMNPGIYVLSDPIVINSMNSSTITIETIKKHNLDDNENNKRPSSNDCTFFARDHSSNNSVRKARKNNSAKFLRRFCRSNSVIQTQVSQQLENHDLLDFSGLIPSVCQPSHATLVMNTDRRNIPVIRVTRGKLYMSRINLLHNCGGTDIWNGNTALQIQPPLDCNGHPIRTISSSLRPTAILSEVAMSSLSGRGMVSIDGGNLVSKRCFVSNCAATGVYVGGPGSSAYVEQTDVICNGHGDKQRRHGVSRGHSGVYLEQGTAVLRECNVSNNSLTGISAVSHHNAFLTVESSDITGNGTIQLEMPPIGSMSREKSSSDQNYISQIGCGRNRSGLNQEDTHTSINENIDESSQDITEFNTSLDNNTHSEDIPHVIPISQEENAVD